MNDKDILFYGRYLPGLEKAKKLLLTEINAMLSQLSSDPETAVVEHIKSRIKDADSLRQKLSRLGLEETVESGLTNLSDIVGVRVITHFIGDIYTVLDEIRSSDKWQVVTVKDYIASPKQNGYRSLHVLLSLPFDGSDIREIKVEIQLRTIAMDCWASLEHQLKYKKHIRNTSLIVAELKRCADEIASTDLSMQTIRDLIHKDE